MLSSVTEVSDFYAVYKILITGRYYPYLCFFCIADVEIIFKVWESHSLGAIPQLSIQLTKRDVFSQPLGTDGLEIIDTDHQ